MTKKTTLILAITCLVLLQGCDSPKPMTRTETIAAVKECKEGGMDVRIMIDATTFAPTAVHCIITDKKE